MQYEEILDKLKSLSNPENVPGMARFGITPEKTYGVSIPTLQTMAKKIGRSHNLPRNFGTREFIRRGYLPASLTSQRK